MNKIDIADWVEMEFRPVELITDRRTIYQLIDNAVRYWNSHSAFRAVEMIAASPGTAKVQIPPIIKSVVRVLPASPPAWILQNYPQWSLLGIAILDNVTADLISMTETFKNYRYYIGQDFRWTFERSDDPKVGGHLYLSNIPKNATNLCVIGTKRILYLEDNDYEIKDEFILDWFLPYVKALVKQVEGNALRKSNIIGIRNDGQELYDEGKEEIDTLKVALADSGKWVAMIRRF